MYFIKCVCVQFLYKCKYDCIAFEHVLEHTHIHTHVLTHACTITYAHTRTHKHICMISVPVL